MSVSSQVEKDAAKKAAVMEVLLAIFSEEGQKHVAPAPPCFPTTRE